MKKILTASLVAMMAVTAARADIASTKYVDDADKVITDSIGVVPTGKTVVGMIGEAQTAATYDDTEVRGLISDNADAIAAEASRADTAEKANAQAIADMDTAYKAADTALDGKITAEATARSDADTAINTKIGEVPTGKTVVGMIGEAQTAATYDDTEVRGLISDNADAIAAEALRADTAEKANAQAIADMDTAYKAADTALDGKITAEATARSDADTAINTKIGEVPTGKTVVGMIGEAQTAATYDDTAVRGLISDNADAIAAETSRAEAEEAEIRAEFAAADTALDTAYKAADTALDGKITAEATARSDADTAINTKIGEVPTGKTVVGMIGEAQTAATYDDTAVRGLISDNADAIAAETSRAEAEEAEIRAEFAAADTALDTAKQGKSTKLSLGAEGGAWVDLTSATANYQTTGTYSLTLVNGTPYWTEVK